MQPGNFNFLMSQAEYQYTVNISFKDSKWKLLRNKVESNLTKILFYSLILSLLGYFHK